MKFGVAILLFESDTERKKDWKRDVKLIGVKSFSGKLFILCIQLNSIRSMVRQGRQILHLPNYLCYWIIIILSIREWRKWKINGHVLLETISSFEIPKGKNVMSLTWKHLMILLTTDGKISAYTEKNPIWKLVTFKIIFTFLLMHWHSAICIASTDDCIHLQLLFI